MSHEPTGSLNLIALERSLSELRACVSALADTVRNMTLEQTNGDAERHDLRAIQTRLWNIPFDDVTLRAEGDERGHR